ncbi:MAG: GMC oxidoreductase [Pseudomonadota bacterium]
MSSPSRQYDFVVVGAGSADCAVAHSLAEREAGSVLVLEAGPSGRWPLVRMPFGLVWMVGTKSRDWQYRSTPQAGLGGREIGIPRGRMIGGSGSINAMVWFRGRADDFRAWDLPGWSWDEVRAAFETVESHTTPDRFGGAHHPVGTLPMGSDTPVTPRCTLRSVAGRRVDDASVMPSITSNNTNAPSMMIGHRAGHMIAEDAA